MEPTSSDLCPSQSELLGDRHLNRRLFHIPPEQASLLGSEDSWVQNVVRRPQQFVTPQLLQSVTAHRSRPDRPASPLRSAPPARRSPSNVSQRSSRSIISQAELPSDDESEAGTQLCSWPASPSAKDDTEVILPSSRAGMHREDAAGENHEEQSSNHEARPADQGMAEERGSPEQPRRPRESFITQLPPMSSPRPTVPTKESQLQAQELPSSSAEQDEELEVEVPVGYVLNKPSVNRIAHPIMPTPPSAQVGQDIIPSTLDPAPVSHQAQRTKAAARGITYKKAGSLYRPAPNANQADDRASKPNHESSLSASTESSNSIALVSPSVIPPPSIIPSTFQRTGETESSQVYARPPSSPPRRARLAIEEASSVPLPVTSSGPRPGSQSGHEDISRPEAALEHVPFSPHLRSSPPRPLVVQPEHIPKSVLDTEPEDRPEPDLQSGANQESEPAPDMRAERVPGSGPEPGFMVRPEPGVQREPGPEPEPEDRPASVPQPIREEAGLQAPFIRYTIAYPTYKGSLMDFIAACIYIKHQKGAIRTSLCDDFIRAWAEEYVPYVKSCDEADPPVKPMYAISWYNDIDDDPLFTSRIITKQNLQSTLEFYPDEVEAAQHGHKKSSAPAAVTRPSPLEPAAPAPPPLVAEVTEVRDATSGSAEGLASVDQEDESDSENDAFEKPALPPPPQDGSSARATVKVTALPPAKRSAPSAGLVRSVSESHGQKRQSTEDVNPKAPKRATTSFTETSERPGSSGTHSSTKTAQSRSATRNVAPTSSAKARFAHQPDERRRQLSQFLKARPAHRLRKPYSATQESIASSAPVVNTPTSGQRQ